MGDVELVGYLGSCLSILARQLECPFQLTGGLVAISLLLVLETSFMMDGRGADDDDLDMVADVLRDGTGNLLDIVLEARHGHVMSRIQLGVGCVVGAKEDGSDTHVNGIVITAEDILLAFGRI